MRAVAGISGSSARTAAASATMKVMHSSNS
jgi:hypothetical protein